MKEFARNFFSTLADVVETNQTHVISFELRRLSQDQRRELVRTIQNIAQEDRVES